MESKTKEEFNNEFEPREVETEEESSEESLSPPSVNQSIHLIISLIFLKSHLNRQIRLKISQES